jgi:hypothetical protein
MNMPEASEFKEKMKPAKSLLERSTAIVTDLIKKTKDIPTLMQIFSELDCKETSFLRDAESSMGAISLYAWHNATVSRYWYEIINLGKERILELAREAKVIEKEEPKVIKFLSEGLSNANIFFSGQKPIKSREQVLVDEYQTLCAAKKPPTTPSSAPALTSTSSS